MKIFFGLICAVVVGMLAAIMVPSGPQDSRTQLSVEEMLKRFKEHRQAFNEHREGHEEYLLYGVALADAWDGDKVAEVSIDPEWLNKQLLDLLDDLAFEPLSEMEKRRYDRVRDKVQDYYDSHRSTPTAPRAPIEPPSRCPECNVT